jgi:serpin B
MYTIKHAKMQYVTNNKTNNYINQISLKFLNHYQSNDQSEIFLSPYSVISALLAVYHASSGKTRSLIQSFFGDLSSEQVLKSLTTLNQELHETKNVSTSNHIITRDDMEVKSQYHKEMKGLFEFDTIGEDIPATVNKINKLVETNTQGMIKDIIDDISPDTVVIILNTIYFKSNWVNPFEKSNTFDKMFNGVTERNVQMMRQYNTSYLYHQTDSLKVIEMFYDGHEFKMGFILPNDASDLLNITADDIYKYKENLTYANVTDLQIPKFKVEKKYDMKQCLTDCNLDALFDKCEMLNMTDADDIFVSQVIHKTAIIVDEEGTEAAAVTEFECDDECCSESQDEDDVEFIADHPFMYYIKHNSSGTILFAGIFQ